LESSRQNELDGTQLMTNQRMQDQAHLRNVAYKDDRRLNARIEFWKAYGTSREDWSNSFFDLIDLPTSATILDVGCGPAHFWEWGAENDRISKEWQFTLTDLSEGMLESAKANLSDLRDQIEFMTADVCELPFEDARFDLIVANYMLYHASDLAEAIREIHRVLKTDGTLLAATNSEGHISELLDLQERHAVSSKEIAHVGLAHTAFTLENGVAPLKQYFSTVRTVVDSSPELATDPEILINYMESMDAELNMKSLAEEVRHHISENGHFAVTRSSGVLVATK